MTPLFDMQSVFFGIFNFVNDLIKTLLSLLVFGRMGAVRTEAVVVGILETFAGTFVVDIVVAGWYLLTP